MSFSRILAISTFTILLSTLFIFLFSPEVILEIYNTKFNAYNELGYFISILESFFTILNLKVVIILFIVFLIGGFINKSENSFKIGIASSLILSFIFYLIIFKYTPDYWQSLYVGGTPPILTYLLFNFLTGLLTTIASGIPSLIFKLIKKRREKTEAEKKIKFIEVTCPNCNEKYRSNPLICAKCGYNFETRKIEKTV
ncbi:MAG: hypothetical protein ACTSYR_00335 [Candidatus Odinarchaeia archaeon]